MRSRLLSSGKPRIAAIAASFIGDIWVSFYLGFNYKIRSQAGKGKGVRAAYQTRDQAGKPAAGRGREKGRTQAERRRWEGVSVAPPSPAVGTAGLRTRLFIQVSATGTGQACAVNSFAVFTELDQ